MKLILSLLCGLAACMPVFAQDNEPTGAVSPSGTSSNISLPRAYNLYGAPTKFNYTSTYSPLIATSGIASLTSPAFYSSSVTYYNGLGSTLQTTVNRLSGDIISAYDCRVLLDKPDYLPYVKVGGLSGFQMNSFADQKAWYATQFPQEGDNAYSRTSVLGTGLYTNTVQYSPGKSFTGSDRGTTSSVEVSDNSHVFRKFVYTPASYPVPYSLDLYQPGELLIKKTTGQNGAVSYECYNKSNQLVCKRVDAGIGANVRYLNTYYIYNELGKIIWVIPPKAYEQVLALSGIDVYQLTNIYKKLAYSYTYNRFGQVTEKGTPGKQYNDVIVYDRKNRVVLTQTSLLKNQGKWAFNIYDNSDRPVVAGFLTSADDRATWQDRVENGGPHTVGSLEDLLTNGCTGTYPTSLPNCEINSYNYYDSYTFDPSFPYSRSFSNGQLGDFLSSIFSVETQPYSFVHGMLTATKTRVLDGANANRWIYTVLFYDQRGQAIQSQTLNPWNTSNWDMATTQYNFDGTVAQTTADYYGFSGGNKASTRVTLRNSYVQGNITNTNLILDNKPGINIATYTYDKFGRVSAKWLGNGIEKQKMTYNIRGQLTGINPEYVANHIYPDATFGMITAYDYGFEKPRFDGGIAGIIWRGAGTYSDPKAYGYEYDNAGRMTGADFNEQYGSFGLGGAMPVGLTWTKTMHDYSVSNITYDANGNMETMKQRGTIMNGSIPTPVDMDDLTYYYKDNGNTLDRMEDAITTNYNLGDFVNGHTAATDYGYDADGNLKNDLNKSITNIDYNALDLPTEVATTANGSVQNIYDAAGRLIEKVIVSKANITERYRYWGPLVYRDNDLQYVQHSEGRSRWLPATSDYAHDFFVKDHLGNVRSVVNYEGGGIRNFLATHELASANLEAMVFENLEKRALKPGGSPSDMEAMVMNGAVSDRRVGTAVMLKVMAGDKFKAEVAAYYQQDGYTPDDEHASSESMAGSLLGALHGGVTGIGEEAGGMEFMNSLLGSDNFVSGYDALKETMTDHGRPRAYLNYVLFDEDMHIVQDQSGAVQITPDCDNNWAELHMPNEVEVGKNGYLVVYMSNESQTDVAMDNFLITYSRGKLLEEQHYYPHGLVVKDGANNPLKNRYLYQGKEMQDESGMQLYDFHARQYDPQIGRFWGIDPMDQFPSGYTGMGNDPANMVDPTGMVANGSGASGGYGTGYNPGGGYVPNPFGEWGHHGGPSSFALMYFDQLGSGGGGSGGGGSTTAESAQGESNSTGNNASVAGKPLPELYVTSHRPDWASWGFEMVNKYGSSLGFDFNSYGDNVGVSAKSTESNSGGLNLGDWGNINSGVGYVTGSIAGRADKILVRNYNGYNKMSVIKTGKYLPYNIRVPTSALKATSTALKGLSAVAGGVGLGISLYQYKDGQITGTEAAIDGAFGIIGFCGPIGAGVSILYFGGKALYEYGTGNTLFEKPKEQ